MSRSPNHNFSYYLDPSSEQRQSCKVSNWFLILRASLDLEPDSYLLELVLWLNLVDLSEGALPLCPMQGKEPTTVGFTNMNKGWFLCLRCLLPSWIGHLDSFISCRPGTGPNENHPRLNHSILYFPIALCFLSLLSYIVCELSLPSSMPRDLQGIGARAGSCRPCHRFKDVLCSG